MSNEFKPYVSADQQMKEFTIRALLIGLFLAVLLGAANAYLGLKAGMTIAATYPAAVIGMALLRVMRGSILEENFTRTVGSIGESVAAGAIFTIPAFFIVYNLTKGKENYLSGWAKFASLSHYIQATLIMIAGGVLGIMFVALLRRVMVEDAELRFPESVAAAEIHKAGRSGGTGAKYLFGALGVGAFIKFLGEFRVFAPAWEKFITFAKKTISLKLGGEVGGTLYAVKDPDVQGGMLLSSPGISPAYAGVGYIIGPKLASLNFSGGLLAWGLLVPAILYFLGPEISKSVGTIAGKLMAENKDAIQAALAKGWLVPSKLTEAGATYDAWVLVATNVWKFIVRPIAIGGMLAGAGITLFRMRRSLKAGLGRSIADLKKAASSRVETARTERDIPFKWVLLGILGSGLVTFFIYHYFSGSVKAALVAALVMIVAGFFFAAVSGYLVGTIGSSNNPISGLTLSTLVIAALLMVALGMKGGSGVAAVLGVAAVVCVSTAVAGEMLQDLKVGHILGGTPWKMQLGDVIGVIFAAAVLFLPLVVLHQGDINLNGIEKGGFGGKELPAPQAGLMAMLSLGIVGGKMAWPLIIVGLLMGFGFILMGVRSPMLVSVGMYLPLETTFAIFIGGLIKGIVEKLSARKKHNEAQKSRVENNGILLASGLIAGEALIGLLFATLAFANIRYTEILPKLNDFFPMPFGISLLMFLVIGWVLVRIPLKNAGRPDEPAAPPMSM